jgi:hypothetical protein
VQISGVAIRRSPNIGPLQGTPTVRAIAEVVKRPADLRPASQQFLNVAFGGQGYRPRVRASSPSSVAAGSWSS